MRVTIVARAKYGRAVAESRLEHYGESEKLLHDILEEQAELLLDSDLDFLRSLDELANVYRLWALFGKAKQCY